METASRERKERKGAEEGQTGARLGNRWGRVAGEILNNRLHPRGLTTSGQTGRGRLPPPDQEEETELFR